MRPAASEELRERASRVGVASGFFDNNRGWHNVDDATLDAVLAAVGDDEDVETPYPAMVVTHVGEVSNWQPPDGEPVEVVLESGEQQPCPAVLPGNLPHGYHQVVGATGTSKLVVAPPRCYLPTELQQGRRLWGWAAQLYALRSRASWGIGDLGDLAMLAADETLQSDFLLINPIHAPMSDEATPYSPSTRVFRDPLYLDLEQVPERDALTGASRERFADLATIGRRLNSKHLIDRQVVRRVKDEALRLCYEVLDQTPRRRNEFHAWRKDHLMVEGFATFCSLQRVFGEDWRTWPAAYRRPNEAALHRHRLKHSSETGYIAWLQWLLEDQLAALPHIGLGFVADLALGVARAGFDAWMFQEEVASGVMIGAPPDAFAPGQNWWLSAFSPTRLTRSCYRPFIAAIRAAMTGVGGLRVDHIMGFFQLFLIPEGGEPSRGTYVRYPSDDLLGILALESQRARALVIGEDFFAVEPGMRDTLARKDILSSRMVWFERDPANPAAPRRASDYPRLSLAVLATHDLPTVTGLFSDSDLRYQHGLGVLSREEFRVALAANQRLKQELLALLQSEGLLPAPPADLSSIISALHAFLARTPAMLIAARLEDALGMHDRPSIPGTDSQRHPRNWNLPLPLLLEEMHGHPQIVSHTAAFRELLGYD